MEEIANVLAILYRRLPEDAIVEKHLVEIATRLLNEQVGCSECEQSTQDEFDNLQNEVLEQKAYTYDQIIEDLKAYEYNIHRNKPDLEPVYAKYKPHFCITQLYRSALYQPPHCGGKDTEGT